MARRNDHTHEQIRQLALARLGEHLSNGPLANMSLRKLAQAIGYSPATLINVFGSYDQLLLSANADTLDQLAARLIEQQPQQATPQQQLLSFAETYLQFARQHRYRWQLLFEHRLPDEEAVPDWQQQRINRLFAVIESALAQLAPAVPAQQLQLAARTIWASVHGICALALDDKLFASADISGQNMIASLIRHYVSDWQQQ